MIWVKNKIKIDKRDECGKVKLNLNVSVVKFQRELCEYQNGSKNKKIKKGNALLMLSIYFTEVEWSQSLGE